jgi:glycosyltransferase involved in cell wall biosynthesis
MVNKRAEHAIEQIVKAEAFDTIYTNVGVLNVGYNVAHRNGLIHIYHLREYQDLDFGERIYPSFQEFSRKIAQKKNYNIAITKGIYQYFHCPSKNSVVIYNGVMNKDDYKTIIWDKQKYFLFVGRLSDGKGVIDAIEAFNVVCHNYPDYKLVLAGGVESKKMEIQIRNKVAQYGLTDSIQFLGMVHHVDELMRKAKALLMCSRSEGLGRVTIEAMANGCLVIGKNAMGTKEQFDNGLAFTGHEIGLRYDTLDELECNMMNVIKNGTDSYKDMIHNAQDTVFHYYTIERCYNSLVNFFQKIEHENP